LERGCVDVDDVDGSCCSCVGAGGCLIYYRAYRSTVGAVSDCEVCGDEEEWTNGASRDVGREGLNRFGTVVVVSCHV